MQSKVSISITSVKGNKNIYYSRMIQYVHLGIISFLINSQTIIIFIMPGFIIFQVQFNPRSEREILVTPMRHAAVVVVLATKDSTCNETLEKSNTKDKESGDTADNKDLAKESSVAAHHIVPLEDEVSYR